VVFVWRHRKLIYMILASHGIIGSQITQFVGLLDTYSGAAAAYSLRKLRSAYTGNAIRVRRSSDNTEQNIGFVDNVLDTSSLTSFCSGTNGFVTTWYDQSGNARNATQTTAANQPQIVSSGSVINLGTNPAIDFLNTSGLAFNGISMTSFTILYVSKLNNNGTNGNVMLSNAPSGSSLLGDNVLGRGNPMVFGGIIEQSLNNNSASGVENTYHLSYLNRRNSTEAVGQFNGSNNSYNNSISAASVLYAQISGYAGGYNYLGQIQELIIYNSNQSSNRTGIETNINSFYSIY